MIALLRGRVATAALGEVVVDVGGVGYRVHVPVGAPVGAPGDEVVLHTALVVREDALDLYGFRQPADRALFTTLLSVGGVGPKLALAALGTLGAQGLRQAVVGEDVAALTVVPGVGRKSAQRIILELREKLGAGDDGALPGDAEAMGPAGAPGGAMAEVRQALAGLGYAPAEVRRALEAAGGDGDERPAEDLLRNALRSLGRKR